MTKKKTDELEQQVGELTLDLQRTRADFENYRKRVEAEKQAARALGQTKAIMNLLPIVDTIERAIDGAPDDLQDNAWVKGILGARKQLTKQLSEMCVERIGAAPGTAFDPEFHQAVQFEEDSEGETEVIAAELQPGYLLDGAPIRHALVNVTRR